MKDQNPKERWSPRRHFWETIIHEGLSLAAVIILALVIYWMFSQTAKSAEATRVQATLCQSPEAATDLVETLKEDGADHFVQKRDAYVEFKQNGYPTCAAYQGPAIIEAKLDTFLRVNGTSHQLWQVRIPYAPMPLYSYFPASGEGA